MSDVEPLIDADELLKEFDALRERRDEAIDVLLDELRAVGGSIVEVSSEVDVQLADMDYSSVEESISQVSGLVTGHGSEQAEELARLTAIEFPNDGGVPVSSDSVPAARQPLELAELPSPDTVEPEKDGEQENIAHVLASRVDACAWRIRRLLGYLSDELWPDVVDAAESGDIDDVRKSVGDCEDISKELRDVFELWSLWLSELCNKSPSHAGLAGEQVELMQQWLAEQSHLG